MNSIAKDAKQLLEDIDLYSVPVNPVSVCEKLGIVYDEQPYNGFDGTLIVTPRNQLIGVSSKIVEQSRKNFTCAHELGHYQYDIATNQTFKCTKEDTGYGSQGRDEKEIRANEFASELLMPEEFFLKEIRNKEPSWALIEALTGKFDTSLQATASRFINLTHHTCWLVVVKNGKMQRFVKAGHNEFPINLQNTFASPTKKPDDWMPVTADGWLYENRKTRDKEILSWPLSQNQYGESLVLLWDDGNTLLDDEQEEEDSNESERWSFRR